MGGGVGVNSEILGKLGAARIQVFTLGAMNNKCVHDADLYPLRCDGVNRRNSSRTCIYRGFTLIELLVVVAIIAILAAMLTRSAFSKGLRLKSNFLSICLFSPSAPGAEFAQHWHENSFAGRS